MTRDNKGRRNDEGDPGSALERSDVVKCRQCGNLVRRVNEQHLLSDRCRYTDLEKAPDPNCLRPDLVETVDEYKEKYPDALLYSPREKQRLREQVTDERVDERRKEMMKARWMGESMTDIVERLADKHNVSESTIWDDWRRRDDWMARVFDLDDAETMVTEALAQKKDVRDRLLRIATRARDENEHNAAIRALKAVDDNIDSSIEVQQSLGEVYEEPQKVEVDGEVEHRHESVGEELDEESLRAIDEMTGGDDEDIVDAEFTEVDEEQDDGE